MEEESTSSDVGTSGKTQLDTWDNRICRKFFTSGCEEGEACKLKHVSYVREMVCKYFLIYGACQKGPSCPFLHDIVTSKLPECKNQTGNSKCLNPSCKFRHFLEKEIKECLYYNLGFCSMGKFCKFKHNRRELCISFIEIGQCPDEACQKYHIKELEQASRAASLFEEYLQECYYKLHKESSILAYDDIYQLCFRCMHFGHHPSRCTNPDKSHVIRCYKCMKYGHKSNACDEMTQNISINRSL